MVEGVYIMMSTVAVKECKVVLDSAQLPIGQSKRD